MNAFHFQYVQFLKSLLNKIQTLAFTNTNVSQNVIVEFKYTIEKHKMEIMKEMYIINVINNVVMFKIFVHSNRNRLINASKHHHQTGNTVLYKKT